MKHNSHTPFLRVASLALLCATLGSCGDQPTTLHSEAGRHSYILPTTGNYNAGYVHDAMLLYINTHYDVAAHAGYPHKFSEAAYDSLAALFIRDSLQSASGLPFSSSQVESACNAWDSVFHACQTALPSRAEFVASINSGLTGGIYALDEATFLKDADSLIRKTKSYAEANDTINSLILQCNATTWSSSQTSGRMASQFLSIARASSLFFGGLNAEGDTAAIAFPIVAHPMTTDADAYANAYKRYKDLQPMMGWTDDEVIQKAMAESTAASEAAGQGNGGVGVSLSGGTSGGPELFAYWVAAVVICILLGL